MLLLLWESVFTVRARSNRLEPEQVGKGYRSSQGNNAPLVPGFLGLKTLLWPSMPTGHLESRQVWGPRFLYQYLTYNRCPLRQRKEESCEGKQIRDPCLVTTHAHRLQQNRVESGHKLQLGSQQKHARFSPPSGSESAKD